MSDSNCNCCGCQYSTPPWWVTMGFTPPANNYSAQPPAGSAGTTHPAVVVSPPATAQPGHTATGGLGGLLGTVAGTVGNTVGTVLGTPANIVSDVVHGIGNVFSNLF